MTTRTHLTIVFDEGHLPDVARLRHRFDPHMAQLVPPHLTVVYPEEHGGDLELLVERATVAAADLGPFVVRLAEAMTDGDDGTAGVFVGVEDPSDGWASLRRAIVTPPMAPVGFPPHVTLVHPRTSVRGAEAWAELERFDAGTAAVVAELCLTVTRPDRPLHIEHRIPLEGSPRHLVAGVVLVDGPRVLLAHRHPEREWYPDAWDVIGGHIEPAEAPAAAARREAAEELGVDIDLADLVLLDLRSSDEYDFALYGTRRWRGTPTNRATLEHDEIAWHHVDVIGDLALADPAIAEVCRRAVAATSRS